jgi:lincosamide nucleotidyltransferase B/F
MENNRMQTEEYNKFTEQLRRSLEQDGRVIGLVALGSMAQQDYQPDENSDHDFFVIVNAGAQESFHRNLSWLPDSEKIVYSVRETAHGWKVLYQSGHIIEFAIFDLSEIALAKVNRYRVLFDQADIAARLEKVIVPTRTEINTAGEIGQFLFNLVTGVRRYKRGEQLSGHQFVKNHALGSLLLLLEHHLPAETKTILDNLDPSRRFERVYSEFGKEINALLLLEVPLAAQGLLYLARRELAPLVPDFPVQAIKVIEQQLS